MQYDAIESVTAVAYLNTMSIGDGNDIIYRDDIFKGKSPKKYFPFIRPGELFAYSFLKLITPQQVTIKILNRKHPTHLR